MDTGGAREKIFQESTVLVGLPKEQRGTPNTTDLGQNTTHINRIHTAVFVFLVQ